MRITDTGDTNLQRIFVAGASVEGAGALITAQPATVDVQQGDAAVLFASINTGSPGQVQLNWRRDGIELVDGPTPWGSTIIGAQSATLTIIDVRPEDEGAYTLGIRTACRAFASVPAAITVEPVCPADFNADGALNDDDLGEFITAYFEVAHGPGGYASADGCPGADAPYDVSGYRADITGDCSLNDDDLSLYITLYFAGCE